MFDKFKRLEQQLIQDAPRSHIEAQKLSESVLDPRVADPDACWEAIWEKPLYANTRVSTAERQRHAIADMMGGAWKTLGVVPEDFQVVKVGKGASVNSFRICGTRARDIQKFGVAPHRMFAIQGAAAALRKRVGLNTSVPYANIVATPVATLIPAIKAEMGEFWGNITVCHLLTDLGVSVKPDIHLVRAVKALGLADNLDDRCPSSGFSGQLSV